MSVEGIVLAAGLSSRTGCNKMALKLGDKSVIQRSVESMAQMVGRIFVIVGWRADSIKKLLSGYSNIEIVMNEDFRLGMFSSIKTGIAKIQAPRFFLLPGDQPLIGAEVYATMLSAAGDRGAGDILIPTFGGRKGHPVLFSSTLIPEILRYPDTVTLRDVVRARGHTEVEVEQEEILIDMDTLEDYRSVLAKYQRAVSSITACSSLELPGSCRATVLQHEAIEPSRKEANGG